MAKGQQSGWNSITVWMIVFVGLWLTSTVVLVILYTGQEDMRNENARLAEENRRLVSPSELSSIQLAKSAQAGGPTVVGLIEEARSKTAEAATGEPADSVAAVREKRDQLLQTIVTEKLVPEAKTFAESSYHEALQRLYTAYKTSASARKAAEDRAARMEGEVARLAEADAQRQNEFDQRIKEATAKLAQSEGDRANYRTERDKGVDKLEKDIEELRKRSTDELTKERQLRQSAEQRLAEVQERFAVQQEKLGGLLIGPEHLAPARKPDGKILTAVPGDPIVYVNLGAKDTLTLGLQFAVYSAQTGIPPDGRGKAQIEVVAILPTSAECRIVWVAPNQVILDDDLIANPIYDPAKPPTFLVVGEFDLDRDGTLDRNGGAAVKALVTNWGGRVSEELTPLTDFVVLGAPPRRAKTTGDAAAGGAAADSEWTRYSQIAESARAMSVPVLTQDVFLNFLGYSARVASR
ncbi:MAG: hypothetical protein AABZ12_11735 [Planctomycetota bacterium]